VFGNSGTVAGEKIHVMRADCGTPIYRFPGAAR
jgi:hypothetical protein